MEKILKLGNLLKNNLHFLLLLVIITIAYFARMATSETKLILDYDPWWFYRHGKNLVENNLVPPKWDYLSYYPPGRPVDHQLGWPYTLAASYLILQNFFANFMQFSAWFVVVFAAICAIPAYFVGKIVTNKVGGLVTALFAVLTPTFISVSMYGYPDSDVVVVFYTFLAILATIYAIENWKGIKNKKSLLAVLLASFVYWLFAFNWNASWYIYYIFLLFIPAYLSFKIFEKFFFQKFSLKRAFENEIKNLKSVALPIILIGIFGGILTYFTSSWPFNTISLIDQLIAGLKILTGKALIVNISVAELQPLNVFSREGFLQVANRIGIFPTIFAIFGLPLTTIYKISTKRKIRFAEIFAIFLLIATFWLITKGIRFSLIFSISVAIASGFVIGNLYEFLKNQKIILTSSFFGLILFLIFWHISQTIQFSYQLIGMELSKNWIDALDWLKKNSDENTLIVTWWDPGHIITGYANLKVHADGAHCGYNSCIPYNHDIRIQDMGRIFSTSNESEAIEILKKYKEISSQDCERARKEFKELMPTDACKPVNKMYLIASSDLIAKYYWLSCFGSFDMKTRKCDGRTFLQLALKGQDKEGRIIYEISYGRAKINLILTEKEGKIVSILNAPLLGIRNKIVKKTVLYQDDTELSFDYEGKDSIDGLAWIDPSFMLAIYMEPKIKDSLFTKMFFFNGKDLKNFELVYSNPEIRIFKVKF